MDDDFIDDYPLLDFMLSDEIEYGGIYAEDQVVFGPDGPELGPIEGPWDDGADDNDDCYDELAFQPQDDEEEEYYVLEPKDLSCCYEEWEDEA